MTINPAYTCENICVLKQKNYASNINLSIGSLSAGIRKGLCITMNILFLGDVVSESGCESVSRMIPVIQSGYQVDFTIINAENAAHGKGVTAKLYNQLIDAGADVITLGNHAFAKREILYSFQDCPCMIRPANMEPFDVGQSVFIKECGTKKIAVINLLGQIFMSRATDDPVHVCEELLKDIGADIVIVDLHAEATSEKIMFAHYFADSLTAVIGTHTHVQTADERIINGCAFISDVGMCGPYDSILGRDIEEVIDRSINRINTTYLPANGPSVICGCLITVDDETNRAVKIERIQIRPEMVH